MVLFGLYADRNEEIEHSWSMGKPATYLISHVQPNPFNPALGVCSLVNALILVSNTFTSSLNISTMWSMQDFLLHFTVLFLQGNMESQLLHMKSLIRIQCWKGLLTVMNGDWVLRKSISRTGKQGWYQHDWTHQTEKKEWYQKPHIERMASQFQLVL